MVEKLDAGPIYFRKKLSLKGSLSEIFIRMKKITEGLIWKIIKAKKLVQFFKKEKYIILKEEILKIVKFLKTIVLD